MTFNEMVVAIQDHLGISGGETVLSERLVNQGKDRYVHAAKWPHLETNTTQLFTTSTRAYAAPSNCESIVSVEDASGNRLLKQERSTYDELHRSDASSAAAPTTYAEEGTDVNAIHQFHVWPNPSAGSSGKIRFLVRVPDLTSTIGTYDHVPEAHHFAILKGAEVEFHQRQGQMNKAALAEQQFNIMIRQLAGELAMPIIQDGSEK